MRCVIQRVSEAKVEVGPRTTGAIGHGLLVLVGFESEDEEADEQWMINKLLNMRIFADEEGVMNKSIQEVEGEFLVVSQFTLHASTKKGHRPSYIKADRPESAASKYHRFVIELAKAQKKLVETGEFGALMKVSLVNDGPVTIIIDSRKRE
ncbi:D-tyrosyl-tRNA(Tyr) deacylase [bacterium]|nr:D-tyrosyl-tRNA(Tyr) deacylase [bacterium]